MPTNLLVILTDQQRFDTIGALGNPAIRTPNMDRLVREGTAFTSAYAPAAECVPSRCCLTFGQDPGRTGCYNDSWLLYQDHPWANQTIPGYSNPASL